MKYCSFDSFKNHIESYSSIPDEIWNELRSILQLRQLKKDEYIVRENQVYNKEIFVSDGVIRGFYSSADGEEFNVSFYQDNELVCPCHVRTFDQRSNINIQALTKADIIIMDQEKMKVLRHKHYALLIYGSMVLENELNKKYQREKTLLLKSAEERYLKFRKDYPHLENKISQYHIASFLNITPVSLSRLRKNMII